MADLSVLTPANIERAKIDLGLVNSRKRRLAQPAVLQKIARLFQDPKTSKAEDVEASLYDKFLLDEDRSRCDAFITGVAAGDWPLLDFRDKRLNKLVSRLKARSFSHLLQPDEAGEWSDFVREKLTADKAPWRTVAAYEAELAAIRNEGIAPELVAQLDDHLRRLRERYRL